jgi:hypothetical protein
MRLKVHIAISFVAYAAAPVCHRGDWKVPPESRRRSTVARDAGGRLAPAETLT